MTDTMTVAMGRAETALLCACARRRAQMGGVTDPASLDTRVDWVEVQQLAMAHGVYELLLEPLRPFAARVPADVLADLDRRAVEVTGQNLNRITQTVGLVELLAGHGIAALPFKGPTMAEGGYGHLSRRVSSDIDLLVEPSSLPRVRPVLLANGYRLPNLVKYRSSLEYGIFPAAGREDTLLPERPWESAVDVHVAFTFWPLGIRLDTRALFERSVAMPVAGQTLRTLCFDDLLLVLALHGLMHGWSALRYVSDVDAVAGLVHDWDDVMRRARAAGMQRALWVAVLMAREMLDTPMPVDVVGRAAQDPGAQAIARAAVDRMFDSQSPSPAWDRAWMRSFLETRRRRLGFRAKNFIYEWILNHHWDDWLGRRGAARP